MIKLLSQHWIKPSREGSANHLIKQHGGNESSKGDHFLQEWEGKPQKKEREWMNEREGEGVVGGISCVHMCVWVGRGCWRVCGGLKSQILNQFFGL